MNKERKQTILTIFANCPVVATNQIAKYFTNAQPDKRASECLRDLEDEKLIEGYHRGIAGQCKVWRLSKRGRDLAGLQRSPVPLNSNKIDHYLSLTDIWQQLTTAGKLIRWRVELREPFGDKKKYCADAFAAYRSSSGTALYMIESQLSPLTTKRWSEKWALASAFMDSDAFKTASFQDLKTSKGEAITIKPQQIKILVLSNQQPDTIGAGTRLPLIIARDIKTAPIT